MSYTAQPPKPPEPRNPPLHQFTVRFDYAIEPSELVVEFELRIDLERRIALAVAAALGTVVTADYQRPC
jgi:hypothetical protein